ncbi:MAG: tripartite tricarboxylate transporter substrate-binding protein [Betaproteobacteria bacterium]
MSSHATKPEKYFSAGLLAFVLCGTGIGVSQAQEYPFKAIRVVTSPAGGGNDYPARVIARAVAASLGQQVVVDNRPTALLADLVAKAPPDGYTLLVTGGAHWIGPLLEKVNYDPVGDFAPITLLDRSPTLLVVHPSLPVKNVRQLIALARAKPGEMNYSVGGTGSSNFIAAVLFNHMAGVNIVRIPYKGTGPAMTAVMSGEVQAIFATPSGAASHVKLGRLRALATGSARPSAIVPGLPTIADSGVPGFASESLHALFAPAKTPAAIVTRLNREVVRALQSAEVDALFLQAGIEAAPGSPDDLTSLMKSEIANIGRALKAAGLAAP